VLLVGAFAPRPQGQKVGPLELAALASLALVGWQAAATGALDPGRVAGSGSNPILLLLPALAFFATAVLFLRLLPPALRLSERAVRRAPFAVRLAFLSAARRPAESAAATTFLAVALGGALFALDYRATLDGQARAQAGFAIGAAWRVTERDRSNPGGPTSVAPLTRFARVSAERPTPVLRLEARLVNADTEAQPLPVDILGLPAGRLGAVRGWRKDFSPMSRDEIADRLRPRLVRLGGPRIAPDARALQVWAQAETERPRIAILHFLLPGQSFAYLPLGAVSGRWRLLRARIPTSLRGAELVGIEFQPTFVPLTRAPDLAGAIRLGPVAELRAGIWRPLASQAGWIAAPPSTPSASGGFVTRVAFAHAPVTHGLRFDLNGTLLPLIRPRFSIPHPLPALVGPSIAAAAVDGITTLDLDGMPLRVRAVARASLFPTVTANRSAFVVVDYDTLFAALNADQPGRAMPSEAWFFAPQRSSFESRLELPPFRGARAFNEQQVQTRLLRDPLAAGTRDVLGVAGVAAAVLALLGLLLATRSMLTSEAPLLAEYEALGVPPTTLVRASQLRVAAGCAFGVAAGLAGALLALRLIGAFVAVTGTGGRPLPPIVPAVSWTGTGILLALLAGLGIVGVSFLARRTLGESTAARLRA
jgi:hypothetical protein